MAPGDVPHAFQKLRIDTVTPKPISSPFTSIKRDDSLADNDLQQLEPVLAQQYNQQQHSCLSPEPYGHQAREVDVSDFANSDALYRASTEHAGSRCNGVDFPDADEGGSVAASEGSSTDASLRGSVRSRGFSVTFDSQKTLDSGHRLSLEQPLPKPERLPRARGRSLMQALNSSNASPHRAHSESETSMFNPFTGELINRKGREKALFRPGESRHPLLQTTVDELARNSDLASHERVASLTSATTASPVTDELGTPLEPVGHYILSPLAASSPVEIGSQVMAEDWPDVPRPRSIRSKSYRTDNSSSVSLRRANRRSTARSVTPSISPAGAFLSQWGREEAASITEPDDEGQEIGDHSEYIIGRQIGFGGFSVVKEVFTIENGEKVRRAVKIVRKQVSGKSEQENEKLQADFEHEVSIWRFLRHRYILPLIAVYDSPFATFCITQLNTGGTLFDLVRSRRKSVAGGGGGSGTQSRGIEPHLARRYSYQLASAIRYLHEDVRVVHRDIKLENCLVDTSRPEAATEGGNLLLCDFGMADFITSENRPSPELAANEEDQPLYLASAVRSHGKADGDLRFAADANGGTQDSEQRNGQDHVRAATFPFPQTAPSVTNLERRAIGPSETSTAVVGSLQYAAPESLDAPFPLYSPAIDLWAYGVVLYALLAGDLPFQHSFEPKLVMLILKAEWDAAPLRRGMADRSRRLAADLEAAEDIIRGCLERDVEKRWSIADVLAANWFEGCMELYGDFDDDGAGAWL